MIKNVKAVNKCRSDIDGFVQRHFWRERINVKKCIRGTFSEIQITGKVYSFDVLTFIYKYIYFFIFINKLREAKGVENGSTFIVIY